jgi:hypothetical protein
MHTTGMHDGLHLFAYSTGVATKHHIVVHDNRTRTGILPLHLRLLVNQIA